MKSVIVSMPTQSHNHLIIEGVLRNITLPYMCIAQCRGGVLKWIGLTHIQLSVTMTTEEPYPQTSVPHCPRAELL